MNQCVFNTDRIEGCLTLSWTVLLRHLTSHDDISFKIYSQFKLQMSLRTASLVSGNTTLIASPRPF